MLLSMLQQIAGDVMGNGAKLNGLCMDVGRMHTLR